MADGWIDKDLEVIIEYVLKVLLVKGSIKNIKRILVKNIILNLIPKSKIQKLQVNKSVINNSIISAFNLLNKKAETIFIPKKFYFSYVCKICFYFRIYNGMEVSIRIEICYHFHLYQKIL